MLCLQGIIKCVYGCKNELVLLKFIYCLNHYFREAEVFMTTTRITVMLICVSAFKVGDYFFFLE